MKPEHRPDARTTLRAATKALAAFDVAAANAAASGQPGGGRPASAARYLVITPRRAARLCGALPSYHP